jgi:hypothetical protein
VSDPIEVVMEEALRPRRNISEHASFSLVNELQSVAARIAGADSECAVGLYETLHGRLSREGRGGRRTKHTRP